MCARRDYIWKIAYLGFWRWWHTGSIFYSTEINTAFSRGVWQMGWINMDNSTLCQFPAQYVSVKLPRKWLYVYMNDWGFAISLRKMSLHSFFLLAVNHFDVPSVTFVKWCSSWDNVHHVLTLSWQTKQGNKKVSFLVLSSYSILTAGLLHPDSTYSEDKWVRALHPGSLWSCSNILSTSTLNGWTDGSKRCD